MENNLKGLTNIKIEKFFSLIDELKSKKMENTIDFLKELVVFLKNYDDSHIKFDDHVKLKKYLEDVAKIKSFFENRNHEKLIGVNNYLTDIVIPDKENLNDLIDKKKYLEDSLMLVDLDDIILDEDKFNDLNNEINDFKRNYSDYYIKKHNELNEIIGNFCNEFLNSSKFKLLTKFTYIPQIKNSLTYSPQNIQKSILTKQKEKCELKNKDLKEKLLNYSFCPDCNKKFDTLYNSNQVLDLVKFESELKTKINQSLVNSLALILNKANIIKKILEKEEYREKRNIFNFFSLIFEIFNGNLKISSEIIVTMEDKFDDLYNNYYSDQVIEVIKEAFQDKHVITVEIFEIFNQMENKLYTEEELLLEFEEKKEKVKESFKKDYLNNEKLENKKYEPIIVFKFRKN